MKYLFMPIIVGILAIMIVQNVVAQPQVENNYSTTVVMNEIER